MMQYISARLSSFSPFSKRRMRPPRSRHLVHTREQLKGPGFDIGEYTYGLPRVLPRAGARLRVGKFCSIAVEVVIDLGYGHRTDLATTFPLWGFPDYFPNVRQLKSSDMVLLPRGDVVIGNDVWIGRGAFIMSGVTIGHGSVVGARSVVTNDVEPFSIVAGNPARLLTKRFDQDTIDRLLAIRRWDWPVEKINRNAHLICSNKLNELLALDGGESAIDRPEAPCK